MVGASVIHLQVSGQVQGVGFRYATCERARELNLHGWVRNRHDGSVEILASGTADACAALHDWAHHGPAASQVHAVRALETNPELLTSLRNQEPTFIQAATQ